MNILVVQSELGVLRGGGENFTRNLFSALAQRGHQVTATFIADPKGNYPITLPSGIVPAPLAGYWSRKLGQDVLSRIRGWIPNRIPLRDTWDRCQEALCWRTVRWHDRRFACRIEKEFYGKWHDFDAIYVHGNSVLAEKISRIRPTILRLPGPVSSDLAPTLKRIHAVCANGDALRHIQTFIGDHATELPIGLDSHLFKPGPSQVRQDLAWSKAEWVVGYVGRLAYIKGVDLLADAFKQLRTYIPQARLLMIGAGEEQGKLREALKEELAQGLVRIEADIPHERLGDWYRAMDVFVMPSRYENYSNAVLEALACEVPFLGSNVGGNPRLVETYGGCLFEAGSVEALCEALASMADVSRQGQRQEMARRRNALQVIGWDETAARLENIIRAHLNIPFVSASKCASCE